MKDEGPDVVGETIELIVRTACAAIGVAEIHGMVFATLILIAILAYELRRKHVKERLETNRRGTSARAGAAQNHRRTG